MFTSIVLYSTMFLGALAHGTENTIEATAANDSLPSGLCSITRTYTAIPGTTITNHPSFVSFLADVTPTGDEVVDVYTTSLAGTPLYGVAWKNQLISKGITEFVTRTEETIGPCETEVAEETPAPTEDSSAPAEETTAAESSVPIEKSDVDSVEEPYVYPFSPHTPIVFADPIPSVLAAHPTLPPNLPLPLSPGTSLYWELLSQWG